jgi:hypothetical protein
VVTRRQDTARAAGVRFFLAMMGIDGFVISLIENEIVPTICVSGVSSVVVRARDAISAPGVLC